MVIMNEKNVSKINKLSSLGTVSLAAGIITGTLSIILILLYYVLLYVEFSNFTF
jgi:preprotein translocase subunit SecD